MNDLAHLTKKIIKFIYVQPEVAVSIEKILKKFKWLNRDDLDLLLKKMNEENYIEIHPKSSFTLETVGTSNDVSYKESKFNKTSTLIPATHVSLTLKGKDNAEEQHTLLLRSLKEFYARPLINSLISAIVGFLLGHFFQSM